VRTMRKRSVEWLVVAPLILVFGTMVLPGSGGLLAPSVAGAVVPGACGSVLLSGSSWLSGGGVDVYSNGTYQGTGTDCPDPGHVVDNHYKHIVTGEEWQCVELINRLYLTKGWISNTWPGYGGETAPDAKDSMYDEAPSGLSKEPNGSISYVGPGDVVSINVYHNEKFVPDGHVLIVNSSGPVTSGLVPLVSQNGGDASDAIVTSDNATLTDGTLTIPNSGKWSYTVIGVVYAPTSPGTTVGSEWTQTNLLNDGCEVQTFEAGHKWTANGLGDAGTYTGGGKTVKEVWTTGVDDGQVISVRWNTGLDEYTGTGTGGYTGGTWKTTLKPGAESGCPQ
jgi:hypothetical protein